MRAKHETGRVCRPRAMVSAWPDPPGSWPAGGGGKVFPRGSRPGFPSCAGAPPYLRSALKLDARHATWHSALGWTLRQCGEADAALAAFRQALELAPEERTYASDMLHALNFASGESAERIFEEHVSWAGR